MEYVALGKTGLIISRLGFGGIPIQRISAAETGTLMAKVKDAGINFIDTAKSYTVSEAYLGEALEGMREKFVLATKSMSRDKEGMKQDIKDSLKKLKTDFIDLYQVHNPSLSQLDQITGPGGALEALMEAREAGLIGHVGLTAHSLEVFERAVEMDWVETVMFPYNIVESQGEELIKVCQERKIGFIAMKPLAGGAIEDADTAIRFILSNPGVSVMIPGMAEEKELSQNLRAAEMKEPLSEKELGKIEAIRKELGSQFCRRCNYCAPCAAGIAIPSVFLFTGYLERYGLEGWARERYNSLEVTASACIECGICETRCPYELPIREMMKNSAKKFGK